MKRILFISLLVAVSAVSMAARTGSLVVQGPSGELSELTMQNTSVLSTTSLGLLPTGGRVVAGGDFDGNGSTDLVLQYDPDGSGAKLAGTFLWRYNGTTRLSVTRIAGSPVAYTTSVGTCDLDKDGNLEYVLGDPSKGTVKAFEIAKAAPYTTVLTATLTVGSPTSRACGVFDMDKDGNDDFLLQDTATSQVRYRYMQGTTLLGVSTWLEIVIGRPCFGAVKITSGGRFVVFDSPDRIQRREFVFVANAHAIQVNHLGGDPSPSWPIVAVVP